jgi:hypothetical protein
MIRMYRRRLEHGFSHLCHCCHGMASSASDGYDPVVHAVGQHSGVVAVPAAPGGGHKRQPTALHPAADICHCQGIRRMTGFNIS